MKMRKIKYAKAINEALDKIMAEDENVMVIGEDVGFIGGNFKCTEGLLEKYGDMRVKDSPISEQGFVGMGVGMALTGLRPIVEVMFSDFLLVAADQVINQMAKITYMSGGQAKVPMTIRCPIGAGRSSAAQHSQSMQAMIAHFPGIKVAVPSTAQEAAGLLMTAVYDDNPVVVFEHKMEYNKTFEVDDVIKPIPFGKARIAREGKDITIAATSSMVMKSESAAERLAKEGIDCEVIDLRTIVPLDKDTIIESVKKTGRLLVVDEAHERCGIGAEVGAAVADDIFYYLDAPVGRIGNPDVPLPFSPALEFPLIPSEDKVYEKVKTYFK
jgi:pyruvate/2-oxoglutarate/acetoin dehydrogenase E1 component